MPWRLGAAALVLPLYLYSAPTSTGDAARTVNELIQTAIENNRELAALRQLVAEARGALKQAGVRPAASVQFGAASARPSGKEEYSAGYSQPVELGGKRGRRIEVAEKDVRLAEANLALRTVQLRVEIEQRFVDATDARDKLAYLDRMIASYDESIRLVEARIAQGDAARIDAQLLQVECARNEAQRRTLEGAFEVALAALRRLCGVDANVPLTVAPLHDAATSITLEQAQTRALELRGELALARLEEQRGAAELRLTEAHARPDVTLSAEYSLRGERFNDVYGLTGSGARVLISDRDSSVRLGVSIPLVNRRNNAGNLEAAAARATAARTLRQHVAAGIPLEVQAAWQRWRAATLSLAVFDTNVLRLSARNLDVLREAYTLGQLRLLDVLNEQRRLIDTQLAYADARAESRRARIALEQAVGGDIQ